MSVLLMLRLHLGVMLLSLLLLIHGMLHLHLLLLLVLHLRLLRRRAAPNTVCGLQLWCDGREQIPYFAAFLRLLLYSLCRLVVSWSRLLLTTYLRRRVIRHIRGASARLHSGG
jgi:hypothetical protein